MEIPRHWRLKAQRYCLAGSICPHCGQFNFPLRPVCMKCHRSVRLTDSWKIDSVCLENKSLPIDTDTSTTFRVDNILKM